MLSSILKEILSSEIKKAKSKYLIDAYNQIESKKNFSLNQFVPRKFDIEGISKQSSLLNLSALTGKPGPVHQLKKRITHQAKSQSIYYKTIASKVLRETKLDEERFRKRIDEAKSMHSPIINNRSILLASQNKSRNVPLYQRITEIQDQRQRNLAQLRETYAKNRESQYGITRVKSASYIESWLTLNKEREKERKAKINNIRIELSTKASNALNNIMTFQPFINENSKTIVENQRRRGSNYHNSVSLSKIDQTTERLYQSFFNYRNNKSEMRKNLRPSFKPTINSGNFNQMQAYMYVL